MDGMDGFAGSMAVMGFITLAGWARLVLALPPSS